MYMALWDVSTQFCMAMEDVMRLGHIYFPYLSSSVFKYEELQENIKIGHLFSQEVWLKLEKGKE